MSGFKKYLSEFIGTATLVIFGCGTAAALGCKGSEFNAAYFMTALAFGLVIVAMAYSIGNISGCHINPAVSTAMLIDGQLSVKDYIGYIVSQFLGGIAGAAVLLVLLGKDCGFGANGIYNDDILISIVIEIILTFVFVVAVLGVTSKTENKGFAGIVIGLSLTLVHIFGIFFTGTSVNPARSLGPAIFAGGAALSNVWVFIFAPIIGGALAAVVYRFLSDKKD